MRNVFTLFLLVLVVSAVYAVQPEGVIRKAPVAPKIDGVLDTVWNQAKVYNIDKNYSTEVPTLGKAGETTWKALWDDKGVYVFLKVNDDFWRPAYLTGAAENWNFDKAEIYFDVNYVLKDGVGPQNNQGHYQFAPAPLQAKIDGTSTTETNGLVWSYKVDAPAYTAEYFIPFSLLNDKEGVNVDKTGTVGFDVVICDKDAADDVGVRRRAVWSNVGAINESWSNMDDCGLVTFEGAEDKVYIEKIQLTGGSITKDNDTLRIKATITPADATIKTLKWTVENKTGKATISSTGLLKAISNGVVTVIADATDGSYEQAKIEITISGQTTSLWEINLVQNGLFNEPGTPGNVPAWSGWVDGATPTTGTSYGNPWKVENGVAVLESTGSHSADQWHYQFNQTSQFVTLPNIPYIVKFKAWSSENRTIALDFEDSSGNNYTRYGTSSDPTAVGGASEWSFPITKVPTWYTFHVTFDKMVATTVHKIQFMLSQAIGTVYLDSILLISEADLTAAQTAKKKVGYFTKDKAMDAAAKTVSDDPVLNMLKADPNLEVTLNVLTDVSTGATADIAGYDVVVIQESMGGGDGILQPAGPLALTKLTKPTLYNKTYAFKTGRALTAGGSATGAETPGIYKITVDAANQAHPLFKGITFTNNEAPLFVTGASDLGAVGSTTKALNYATGLEISAANTLLALPSTVTGATLSFNDIPANTTLGGEKIPARMIAVGMNFGAMCANNGKNLTAEGLTIWRNAVYSLAGLPVPSTLVAVGTGVNRPVMDENIYLYPNPARDRVYITVTHPTEVGIYSVTGSLMKMKLVSSSADQMDISNLPRGLYFVRPVKSNEFMLKLMIQ